MRSCWPVGKVTILLPATACGRPSDQFALAGDCLARVVDHDELFFSGFTGKKVVVLAGEGRRLASEVGQQGHVVPHQRFRRDGGDGTQSLGALPTSVRAVSRPLQVLPIDGSSSLSAPWVRSAPPGDFQYTEYCQGELADIPQVRKARQLSAMYMAITGIARRVFRADCVGIVPSLPDSTARNCLDSQRGSFSLAR